MATFRDFIHECEMYEYSNDYYQFLKDVSSAELMARYTENQRFINTYGDYMKESGIVFESGYFTEAVDMGEVELIEEKFTDTIRKVWNTIRKGILKLLNGIIKFLQRKSETLETKIRATKIDIFFKGKVPKGAIDAFSAAITKIKQHGGEEALKLFGMNAGIGAGVAAGSLAGGFGLAAGINLTRKLIKHFKKIKAEAGAPEAQVIEMSTGVNLLEAAQRGESIPVNMPNGLLPYSAEEAVSIICEAGEAAAIDDSVAAASRLKELDKKINDAEAKAKGVYLSLAANRKTEFLEKAKKASAAIEAKFKQLDSMSDNDQMSRSNSQEQEFQALKTIVPKLSKWTSKLIETESKIDKLLSMLADAVGSAARFMGEAQKADEFGDTAGAEANRDAAKQELMAKDNLEKDLAKTTKERNTAAQNTGKYLKQADEVEKKAQNTRA